MKLDIASQQIQQLDVVAMGQCGDKALVLPLQMLVLQIYVLYGAVAAAETMEEGVYGHDFSCRRIGTKIKRVEVCW